MKKSSFDQLSLKYDPESSTKPKEIIFKKDSIENATVKYKSRLLNKLLIKIWELVLGTEGW